VLLWKGNNDFSEKIIIAQKVRGIVTDEEGIRDKARGRVGQIAKIKNKIAKLRCRPFGFAQGRLFGDVSLFDEYVL